MVLGFKATPRDDTRGSPAQLTFGQQLRLPGEFVPSHGAATPDRSFLDKMHKFFAAVTPFPMAHKRKVAGHVPKEMSTCRRVWLEEVVKTPLTPPYSGPYDIIERSDKYFTIDLDGRHENVSMDRLKPVVESASGGG